MAMSLTSLIALCLLGCSTWRGTEPVVENPVVEHYRRIAEQIAYPDPNISAPAPQNLGSGRPLVAPKPEEIRLISLGEVIRQAMNNNQLIRQNAQFMSPQNPVLANPDFIPWIFDPQIQDNGVIFGTRGTHAALSDFDPRFSMTLHGGRDATAQNSILQSGNVLTNDFTNSEMRFDQQLLTGGVFAIKQNWVYSDSNAPNLLFDSTFAGALGAEFRQPLWAGFGREYTSIAGPVAQQARGFSFVNQGVVIARINNRIAEIDFEENLQNMLRELGEVYWELYQAFHEFEAEQATTLSAKRLWDDVKGKVESGLIGEAEEAQAEDAFHEATSRKEQALALLFQSETRLRRMMGLPIEDGQILRPSDDPQTQITIPQRTTCLFEALTNRIELRRQKSNIQSLELQWTASKNLANPRLDFVAGASLNGFGRRLMTGGTDDGITQEGFNNAYASLLRGKETSWNLGVEYTVPLWLRTQRAQMHQLEFKIVKARNTLALQEDEIARELYTILQSLDRWQSLVKVNQRRRDAAKRRVDAAESEYRQVGRTAVDPVLRAEMSHTQAQIAYFRALAEYNKAQRDLMYRMGKLVELDGIQLLDSTGVPVHPDSMRSQCPNCQPGAEAVGPTVPLPMPQ
jgi:outer membrane protein TolC